LWRCCGVVVALLFRRFGVVGVVTSLMFASGILAVERFQGLDHDWIMIETRTMATEGFRKSFG
jgi:hypothetical protein